MTISRAFQFVFLLGFVSLFADVTYEGARSISGQYLGILGAGATTIAIITGISEFLGYALRLVFGHVSDVTKRYWTLTIAGYIVNVFAAPLLALAGSWQVAALLIILERVGKAIRTPSRDAMLSYATQEIGRGTGFGIHQALDRTGSVIGPLLVMSVLYLTNSYPLSFAYLFLPALLAIALLLLSQRLYPHPEKLEKPTFSESGKLSNHFWMYLLGISLVGFGYVDYPLIAYHLLQDHFPEIWIPFIYALSMAASGLTSLLFGYLYDKRGMPILTIAVAISALFAPLSFLGNPLFMSLGVIVWGIGLGTQNSLMRAVIPSLVHPSLRGTAYGILNTAFGLSWLVGSIIIGVLYTISLIYLAAFSFLVQIAAIPIFLIVAKRTPA